MRASADGISSIEENRLLAGELDYGDMQRLVPNDEPLALRAMHHLLVSRGLCLREVAPSGAALLVFPSYFRRERPSDALELRRIISYAFTGTLDETYATLVVHLHHTPGFKKKELWRNAATFLTSAGDAVELSMTKLSGSEGEITVCASETVLDSELALFLTCVEDHVAKRDAQFRRVRHYRCQSCGYEIEGQRAVRDRLARGFRDIVCPICEQRVLLEDSLQAQLSSTHLLDQASHLTRQSAKSIDKDSEEFVLAGHVVATVGETPYTLTMNPHPHVDA